MSLSETGDFQHSLTRETLTLSPRQYFHRLLLVLNGAILIKLYRNRNLMIVTARETMNIKAFSCFVTLKLSSVASSQDGIKSYSILSQHNFSKWTSWIKLSTGPERPQTSARLTRWFASHPPTSCRGRLLVSDDSGKLRVGLGPVKEWWSPGLHVYIL